MILLKLKRQLRADLASLAAEVAGGSTSATAIAEGSELQSSVSSTRWAGTHIVEHSITFANNNALRWFFNAGGTMRMTFTRNGNGGTVQLQHQKMSSVDELITAVGNFDLKAAVSTRSGSGETLTTDGFANGVMDLGTRLHSINETYTIFRNVYFNVY